MFDNEEAGNDGGRVVDFEMVAKLLETASQEIDLLFLAACDTLNGAGRFLTRAKSIVAMSDNVDDEAASKFSERFYRSIAGGASLEIALAQSKLLLEHDGIPDGDLPTLVVRQASYKNMKFE